MNIHLFIDLTDWIDGKERAGVPVHLCAPVRVCTCAYVSREASHTLVVINLFPDSTYKGEMEAILLLVWPPYTEVLIIVAICHIYPCGTYCIYPA